MDDAASSRRSTVSPCLRPSPQALRRDAGALAAAREHPLDQVGTRASTVAPVLHVFTPFSYGAMGACVSLLRSLHVFIYERTYDFRRESEYANRILLGMVSGGAVVVLIQPLGGGEASPAIRFSSAARGS